MDVQVSRDVGQVLHHLEAGTLLQTLCEVQQGIGAFLDLVGEATAIRLTADAACEIGDGDSLKHQ